MFKGFRAFLLRGNVVDLAVGVVIGIAFGVVITAFVKDLVTPLIAALGGKPDFANVDFLNALLAFALIAAVIYFFVVLPINALVERSRKEPPADPTTKKCTECLSEIPVGAKRCAFCAQPQ